MERKAPYIVALVIQSIYAGMYILTKVAFDDGMNPIIFVFYRQATATLFLAPVALFFLKRITLAMSIYGVALKYTSATLAAGTSNSIPVTTFILAVLLGMETVKICKSSGIAKVIGIAFCAIGALTIAFYRGPNLKLLLHHHLFSYHDQEQQNHSPSGKTWIKGVFLMLLSYVTWATWLVMQNQVLKSYPSKLLSTTLQCFMSTIQSFVVSISITRNPSEWRLGWNVKLLAVAYCGIVVTGLTFYLQAWVMEKRGPVFFAMTTPLAFILTIAASAVLLGETISLGSILGGTVLIGGLYCVLWGKTEEQKVTEMEDTENSDHNVS